MIALRVDEILAATGGRAEGLAGDAVITGLAIDSRRCGPGDLFIALRGEHADGHDYIGAAIEAGATAALVREPMGGAPVIVVDDPLAAMTGVGAAIRDRLACSVIAITGSAGKTGTKDLTVASLGTHKRVAAAAASFNNEIGVPLTLSLADADTEVLVVEVGARGPGHIASLMPAVRPDVAIVTNVGNAHVGEFGSIEVTQRSKAELPGALRGGTAILNADDPRVRAMADAVDGTVVLFGRGHDADVRAADVTLDEAGRARFTIIADGEHADAALSLVGEHHVPNALAAVAAARAVGVPLGDAAAGLASCVPGAGRMQVRTAGERTIIDDTYNASPEAVAAALRTLVTIARGRPTCAILGEMAELGAGAVEAHDRIGRLAVRLGVGSLIVVGREARAIHEAARLEGMFGGESHLADTVEDAIGLLPDVVPADAVVLVKASRVARLERIVEALGSSA